MSDTLKTLSCPACAKDMKKIYLSDLGINIDFCEKCGGLLFDNRELEKLQANSEVTEKVLTTIYENGDNFEETDHDTTRICPVCEAPMVKIGTNVDGIEVDVCNTCGAKYLDNYELQKLQEAKDDVDTESFEKIDKMIEFEAQAYSNNKTHWYNFYTPKRRERFYNLIKTIRNL